ARPGTEQVARLAPGRAPAQDGYPRRHRARHRGRGRLRTDRPAAQVARARCQSGACGVAGTVRVMTRDDCLESDKRDPLAEQRKQFVLPDNVLYFDGNSLGALPRTTAGAVAKVIEAEWGAQLIRGWNDAGWMDAPRRVGAKIARLIGALPHEV